MEAMDVIKNLTQVWFLIIASLCYCYYISAKIPKGRFRLLSLLPIFCIFTAVPLRLSSTFATAVTSFFITWLANFKLLLFAFDHGPLSWHTPKSLPTFITIAALPIKINQNKNHPLPKKKIPQNLAIETSIFAILVQFVIYSKENLHPTILLILYSGLLFLIIDILVALSGGAVKALVGLELEPPSDEPYLSTSLQDFWGRRWNLTVTNTLRHTVYKPVRTTSADLIGNEWAPLPAVMAVFVVSGLMHELLFYFITRASPTWETTSFFAIHGVCVVLEMIVKRGFREKVKLPWMVSGPLTVGFVMATSFWLFFPPLMRNGADAIVLEEFRLCLEFLKRKVMSFL